MVEDFLRSPCLPDPLPSEPFAILKGWLDEAVAARHTPNPNAMTLATVDSDGAPSCRVVLCRGIDTSKGTVTFFTNYHSRKGRALLGDGRACVNFHFDHFERQARVEGIVAKVPGNESDAYFASRPLESRFSAWLSDQSEPIESRIALLLKFAPVLESLRLTPEEVLAKGEGLVIPRPPHWGGFRLYARRVELWMGGKGRLHDRAQWVREVSLCKTNEVIEREDFDAWRSTRVQP
jgi:pyridoxamine 5'-phosphate oxidase